jgi:hypothetical protein
VERCAASPSRHRQFSGFATPSGKIPAVAELEWLTDIATFAAGGVVALGSQLLLRRIERKDVPRRRAQERSEQAAHDILESVAEAYRRYEVPGDPMRLPDYKEVSDLVVRINQSSLYILNEERAWLDGARCASFCASRHSCSGGPRLPHEVTWELLQSSHSLLGAMLRDEKIPDSVGKVEDYAGVIDDYVEMMFRERLEERDQQRKSPSK